MHDRISGSRYVVTRMFFSTDKGQRITVTSRNVNERGNGKRDA